MPLPIFIHIHKCGGSSLAAVMRRNLYKTSSHLLTSCDSSSLVPIDLVESIVASARRDGYVMGHIGFGAASIFDEQCKYYTMLRDPKARLISLWRHATSTPDAYYYRQASGRSIEQFLAGCDPLELDNGLVRFLSGDVCGQNIFINPKPFGCLDETDLERALFNLEHRIDCFGLVEQFDASLLMMKPLLNLSLCLYERRNESSASVPIPTYPDQALPLVHYDALLYQEASRIFATRIAQQPPSFSQQLRSFQSANRSIQPIFKAKTVAFGFLRSLRGI